MSSEAVTTDDPHISSEAVATDEPHMKSGAMATDGPRMSRKVTLQSNLHTGLKLICQTIIT